MSLLETVVIFCPYCGEPNEVVVDTTLTVQDYIEDCAVCYRPMLLHIVVDNAGRVRVEASNENA